MKNFSHPTKAKLPLYGGCIKGLHEKDKTKVEDRLSLRKLAAREPVVFDIEGFAEQDEDWDEEGKEGGKSEEVQAENMAAAAAECEVVDISMEEEIRWTGEGMVGWQLVGFQQ